MSSDRFQRRIDAMGVNAQDAVTQGARELLKLYDAKYHEDLDNIYRQLEDMGGMITALAQGMGDLLVETRNLRAEWAAWRGGIELELGTLSVDVVQLKAREAESSRP